MNLTTLLGKFDYQGQLYNGFQALTFEDVSAYSSHLSTLHDEYFVDLKEHIDKILLKDKPISTIKVFLDNKLSDFKVVEEKLRKRDEAIEEQRNNFRYELSINSQKLSDFGKGYVSQAASNLRLIQDYFNDKTVTDALFENLLSFEKEFEGLEQNILMPTLMEKSQRNWIRQSIERLKELYNSYVPESTKSKDLPMPKDKDFIDYLHHNNKEALMGKLHELLDGQKGKVVALTIQALLDINALTAFDNNRSIIYDAMKVEFGEIGTESGLNVYFNPNGQYFIPNRYVLELGRIKQILEAVR